jgi:hypothetical protein
MSAVEAAVSGRVARPFGFLTGGRKVVLDGTTDRGHLYRNSMPATTATHHDSAFVTKLTSGYEHVGLAAVHLGAVFGVGSPGAGALKNCPIDASSALASRSSTATVGFSKPRSSLLT